MEPKISALICTFNEVKRVKKLVENLKDCDEIVFADDGSTDGTRELAIALGAKAYIRKTIKEIPTQEDVDNFKKRFGWEPRFTTESKLSNGAATRAEALKHVKNDWVFFPDADELVTWDYPEIVKLLPNAKQIVSEFVHSHKPDGTPERVSTIVKLFNRKECQLGARVHDVIIPTDKMITTNKMRIDHWQEPNTVKNGVAVHGQGYVLPILEYSVIKDDDSRSRFYLGREYYYRKEFDRALQLLEEYLKVSTFQMEIAQAWLYKSRCYWESQRGDQAREACLEAIRRNPDFTEALYLIAEQHYEPAKHKWLRIAENSKGEDVLF